MVAPSVLIIGTGGHARVIESILALDDRWQIAGVVDHEQRNLGERIGSTTVVATWEQLGDWRRRGCAHAALALGDNEERAKAYAFVQEAGLEVISLIHPSATIETSAVISKGVVICAGALVMAGATIGENSLLNTGVILDHESTVGSHSHVASGVTVAGRVRIGSRTLIGAGSTVLPGIRIGDRVTVGAGSVVTADVPNGRMAMGVPAVFSRSEGSVS